MLTNLLLLLLGSRDTRSPLSRRLELESRFSCRRSALHTKTEGQVRHAICISITGTSDRMLPLTGLGHRCFLIFQVVIHDPRIQATFESPLCEFDPLPVASQRGKKKC